MLPNVQENNRIFWHVSVTFSMWTLMRETSSEQMIFDSGGYYGLSIGKIDDIIIRQALNVWSLRNSIFSRGPSERSWKNWALNACLIIISWPISLGTAY